ncbi:MAG: hypothetical protein HY549_09815 [Elusimicrobia bacterium]|nr:hypothetical protein [Elusimicrobiota bacterium]
MSLRPIEELLSRLSGVKQSGKGYTARCPAHEDRQSSLSLQEGNDARVLLKCFAGCKTPAVVEAMGLRMRDLFAPDGDSRRRKPVKSLSVAALAADKKLPEAFLKDLGVQGMIDPFGNEVVQITYRRADGVLAQRQRIRTALRAKDGSRWTRGSGGLIPYGLWWKQEEARKAKRRVIVEGESDFWTLAYHGYPALGIPGADLAKTLEAEHLEGIAELYVVQEPDKGGEAFTLGVAARLKELGWSGKAFVVSLNGDKDPNGLHQRDPDNFKAAFDRVLEAATVLPEPPPTAPPEEPLLKPEDLALTDDRPVLRSDDRDLKYISAQAWAALKRFNDPPRHFRYGDVPVRIERDDNQFAMTRELTQDRVRFLLARAARWFRKAKSGDLVPDYPPVPVVRDMLATPEPPLPCLIRVVESPVFAPDGRLQTEPGYHPASKTYYAPAEGFCVPTVSEQPGAAEIENARALLEEMLCDFPFVGEAEKAHAVALLLLTHARDLIAGSTPLHLIEAPSPGTGKGLLSDVLSYPSLGRPAPTMSAGSDEEEWRKRITAKALSSPSVLMIDNLRFRLDSAALSAAITSPAWEDRILGQSRIVCMPLRCVWLATGNNPGLSTEISRRTVRIRLDAKQDRPWLRKQFRHQDLKGWVKENRGGLVWAALTLIQAWLAAGKPLFKDARLGMFESWSSVIGGILEVAGIKGFLGNLEQLYEASDAEGALWRGFVQAWWDKFQGEAVGVSQLFEVANALDQPLELGKGTEKSQKTRLGQDLVKMRDRQLDSLRIVLAGERQRAKVWKLVQVGEPAGEPVNVGEPSSPPSVPNDLVSEELPLAHTWPEPSPRFTGSPAGKPQSLPVSLAEWPPYWKDLFEERAGILEHEDGFSREEAEARAEEILRESYAQQEQPA